MNLAHLQAFASVAQHASFSTAAEALHLTQPAVSKRIVALEQSLDTRLFDRTGRQVLLTEAGQVLLEHATRVLEELDAARRRIHDLSGNIRGRLIIATSHHVGLRRLPPVLQAFKHRFPEVRLELRFLESEEALAVVAAGDLELAVVTLPQTTPPRLIAKPLWRDELQVVCGRDHPLATVAEPSLADLAAHPAILPEVETVTRQIVQQAFSRHDIELSVEMSTNHLETIRMMVILGLGWSVLPATLVDTRLCILPVAGVPMQRDLGAVRQHGRTLSNAAQALLATLGEHAESPIEAAIV
ncbi:MAG: LysR family transcriptional regulator [Gammaproteobacteria bacterium]|nr:MAG: LysR family transcriptional regulator [Gammaproteobacteria bacterium]